MKYFLITLLTCSLMFLGCKKNELEVQGKSPLPETGQYKLKTTSTKSYRDFDSVTVRSFSEAPHPRYIIKEGENLKFCLYACNVGGCSCILEYSAILGESDDDSLFFSSRSHIGYQLIKGYYHSKTKEFRDRYHFVHYDKMPYLQRAYYDRYGDFIITYVSDEVP